MSTATSQPSASAEPVPRLRDGDRLSVPEFLRRYAADPVVVRAELIDGAVEISRRREVRNGIAGVWPGLKATRAQALNKLNFLLGHYAMHTRGTRATGCVTLILNASAALEPDCTLRVLADRGGKARVGHDDFLHGSPELVIEAPLTSGPRDFGPKSTAYESAGVPEYLVWRTAEQEVHWLALRNGAFVPLEPDASGVIRSEVFPGLWLNVPALLAGQLADVLATLQLGLASPEHAAFVAQLHNAHA